MSFVTAMPELVESAAQNLAGIHSSLAEAAATAAGPTTGIATAAQDEVSVAIASMFGNVGQEFQALSAQAQTFHQQFVSLMGAGAGAYASAEAANALQTALGGGVLGNIAENIRGAVSGAEASLVQLGQSFGGAVTALQNGTAAAQLSGQIQADVNAVSAAVAGAPTALSGAVQTGGQAISHAVTGFETQLAALGAGGAPGLVSAANTFGSAVAAPYQALVANTVTNLQAIGSSVVANPFPFAHQLINNQIFYAQNIASAIGTGIQNLPAELAALPATLQSALQGLSNVNPGALLQQFITNQTGYAQTILTSLQGAGQDLVTGVQQLPAGFQAAFQDLLVGNNVAAYGAINQTLLNAFLPGFDVHMGSGIFSAVVPQGVLGDLAPILEIPGQMAQNFTNLLPAGSIPQLMAQNATNLIEAFTNLGTTLGLGQTVTLSFGIPLQLILDGVGAPANALSALNSSAVAFTSALQTGNVGAALASVIDAPANVANGFLNGTTLVSLPGAVLGGGLSSVVTLPLGGLLTPLSFPSTTLFLGSQNFGSLPVTGGTPVGGLIPGLLSFPAQLAQAIALPAPILPPLIF